MSENFIEEHSSSECYYTCEIRYTKWGRILYFLIRVCNCEEYTDRSHIADYRFIYENDDGVEKHHSDDCYYLATGDDDEPTLTLRCYCDFLDVSKRWTYYSNKN